MSDEHFKQGEFCWHELMTNDVAKAKDFYCGLLNWTTTDIGMGEFTYTMFKSGDKEICGLMEIPKEKTECVPPHWMSYILVDDIKNMVDKAKNLGAEIKLDIKSISDMGKLAIIEDPTGAHIAFWETLKK